MRSCQKEFQSWAPLNRYSGHTNNFYIKGPEVEVLMFKRFEVLRGKYTLWYTYYGGPQQVTPSSRMETDLPLKTDTPDP